MTMLEMEYSEKGILCASKLISSQSHFSMSEEMVSGLYSLKLPVPAPNSTVFPHPFFKSFKIFLYQSKYANFNIFLFFHTSLYFASLSAIYYLNLIFFIAKITIFNNSQPCLKREIFVLPYSLAL